MSGEQTVTSRSLDWTSLILRRLIRISQNPLRLIGTIFIAFLVYVAYLNLSSGNFTVERFIRQVISPAVMEYEDTRKLLTLTTDFGDVIARNTAFYELEFNLDRELLWKVVSEIEESIDKGDPER